MLFIPCLLVELEKHLRYLFVILRFALGTKRPLMTIFISIARKLCLVPHKNPNDAAQPRRINPAPLMQERFYATER